MLALQSRRNPAHKEQNRKIETSMMMAVSQGVFPKIRRRTRMLVEEDRRFKLAPIGKAFLQNVNWPSKISPATSNITRKSTRN